MDGVFHLHAARLQQIGKIPHRVLGLRHGQSIAGDHDDPPGGIQQHRHFVGRGRLHLSGIHPIRIQRAARGRCNRTRKDIQHGAIHRPAHDFGQDHSGGAHERTGDNENMISQDETGGRGGQPRAGVQEGNGHRHVGAPDRDHQQNAQNGSHHHHRPINPECGGVDHQPCPQGDSAEEQHAVE